MSTKQMEDDDWTCGIQMQEQARLAFFSGNTDREGGSWCK